MRNIMPRLIAVLIGLPTLAIFAPMAAACAGPHCDPNWAFQNQMLAQRDAEARQMEMHRRQMDMYYGGSDSSAGGATPSAPPAPPRYVPPPPPKGWQPRFTGFVSFKVGEDEDRDSNRFRYDYAIAMNYPTEAEARAAAAALCRQRVLRNWESYDIDYKCESETYVYRNAFLSLVTYWNGSFGLYEQPTRQLAVSQHGHGVTMGGRTYYCADLSRPTPDSCQSWLFGIGLNGAHRDRGNPEDYRIFPCPAGPADRRYKIVGIDRLSGTDVPVCGPDAVTFTLQDRTERWDAYAVHPRYVLPFAVGGFSDVGVARQAALAMCNQFTGGGCLNAGEAKNGFAAWVRNDEGKLVLGTGADEQTALRDALARCAPGQVIPCRKVITRMTGDLRVYGPRYKPSDYRYFGAAALPGGRVGEDRQSWVASNFESQAEADRAALDACNKGNSEGLPCRVVGRGLGTRFFGYSANDGSRGIFTLLVLGGNTLIGIDGREEAMLATLCQPKGLECKTEGALDSSDSGEGQEPRITTLRWPLN